MRLLPKPTLNQTTVFSDCAAGVSVAKLSAKLSAANNSVNDLYQQYASHAANKQLHMLTPCRHGHADQVILENITKAEFVDLYQTQMSSTKGAGRPHYDKLRLTKLGICPFCGFGHVSTLDHFAAKSRYPAFSVLPINLVPSCADCNKGKGSGLITVATEMSHPYFEDPLIETDTWLICDVVQTTLPVTVTYRTLFPPHWNLALTQRIQNHFNELNLAERYAVQAVSHLADTKNFLSMLNADDLQWYMDKKLDSYAYPNEWEPALYAGLMRSDWFMQTGYLG